MSYAHWVGPCEHGRDPWDRCDMCGELDEVEALANAFHALTREVEDLRVKAMALEGHRRVIDSQEMELQAQRAALDMLRGEIHEQRRVAAEEFSAAREAEKQLSETRAECCAEFNRSRTLAEELRKARHEIHLLESEAGNARCERDEWKRAVENEERKAAEWRIIFERRRQADDIRLEGCRAALDDMTRERDELRAWQVAVAEGLGFLTRAEGQDGCKVATAKEVIDGVMAWRFR